MIDISVDCSSFISFRNCFSSGNVCNILEFLAIWAICKSFVWDSLTRLKRTVWGDKRTGIKRMLDCVALEQWALGHPPPLLLLGVAGGNHTTNFDQLGSFPLNSSSPFRPYGRLKLCQQGCCVKAHKSYESATEIRSRKGAGKVHTAQGTFPDASRI